MHQRGGGSDRADALRRTVLSACDPLSSLHAALGEPLGDSPTFEPEQPAPFDERDPTLEDEAADMALPDAQEFGDFGEVEQPLELDRP